MPLAQSRPGRKPQAPGSSCPEPGYGAQEGPNFFCPSPRPRPCPARPGPRGEEGCPEGPPRGGRGQLRTEVRTLAGAAPTVSRAPHQVLSVPSALPSGPQPRIHHKPCAPAASLPGRLPAPRLPLLAPAGAAPRARTATSHHMALFTRTFCNPPGSTRGPSPRAPGPGL